MTMKVEAPPIRPALKRLLVRLNFFCAPNLMHYDFDIALRKLKIDKR